MDAFYERWSEKRKALANAINFAIFAVFLMTLLIWGIKGSTAAVALDQTSRTVWGPPLAPIKIIMVTGMVLMLLQGISEFLKNLAILRGKTIV
jgi:TRAP-type mannitol/chloroaromatic compound transport system permease small subunit